ncbi:hypothetical protein H072_6294 [Dactylellina haptotyla CBS 200.50]|uniref:Uncharacterized protein n=1 Tax=Dactylellina haptotyla (strain CBS 200.50) TaxID=1284197 RepID=S8AAG9_DACHA|nr:hypothetical protein H072_6294 [Dactylellina haptotyla CBS 200.50]
MNFTYTSNPSRVIFGSGTLSKLASELSRQNLKAPLILCTPQQISQAKHVASLLPAVSGTFSEATMHTPTHITEKALEFSKSSNSDSIISIGGGSTIGLGKAISIRTGLPHICIPTTYAGSEMTPILGETQDGRKTTRSDPKILPGTVIYDVDLTMTLPAALSATSGVNSIAHAVEALYSSTANPITTLLALEGIKSLAESLPTIVSDAASADARSKALYGAWLCASCLGTVGMALHHKLCHTLGGSFNLPHAETHTIVLPHALAYNSKAIPNDVLAKLADALPGSDGDPVKGLNVLLNSLGVKRALKDFGMKEEDVDKAAEIATSNPYYNPREIKKEEIREVIRRAVVGEEARADI